MADTNTSVNSATVSPSGARGNLYNTLTLPPEVSTVTKTIGEMKAKMGSMGALLDAVGKSTTNMVQNGTEKQTAQHLKKIRKELDDQQKKQEYQIQEIQVLLQKALEHDVIEHLRTLVEAGVLKQIDELVKEQVAAQLPSYFPNGLQEQLDRHMLELDEVNRALHNSESRRANAQLRSSHLKDPLHTIYKSDGTISPHFPRDVSSLFNMDAETAKELCQEYGLTDLTDIRERNINRFMQFCGMSYQLVTTKAGSPVVLKKTKPAAYE
ncbi:hypothetical protein QCA50_004739 [Cerrena zonata]|uniref:Uncharacterized protein n=1 Tax=Cerrena zonata TaxID=2478898 RepID=A0AAW0GP14_9APHY